MNLPQPTAPASQPIPLVVYGASSAVGTYVLQLATRANIHPLICVAGRAQKHVESFIDRSKGDTIIDYRQGNDAVVKELQKALGGEKLLYAFDAVSDKGSFQNLMQVMDHDKGKLAVVLARKKYDGVPDSFQKFFTQVGKVHGDHYPGLKGETKRQGQLGDIEFGAALFKMFERGLFGGWFNGHPYEVVPGGLNGVEKGLSDLKAGKASAVKYVYRIDETAGLSGSKL